MDPIPVPRVRSSVLCCPPDFLPATKGQRKGAAISSFPSPFRIPDLPKILTVREIFEHESQDTRRKVPALARKQQLRADTATRSNLPRRVYARYNLARVAKFRPPSRKETIARGKIQTTSRISRIVDFFSDERPYGFMQSQISPASEIAE